MNSTSAHDCLLEIGCEELPTASLQLLSQALANLLAAELRHAQFEFEEIRYYATPRRLAVVISKLTTLQPARYVEQLGPPISQAYDEMGEPTAACIGFARSCGVMPAQLEKKITNKGERVCYVLQQAGGTIIELLPQFINQALAQLPIAKPMRWGAYQHSFVRPIHWIVLLYGDQLIDATILGMKTQQSSYGHRFHHPEPIFISQANQYAQLLAQSGYVLADFNQRKEQIRELIAQRLTGDEQAIIDEALLDEVTALVEWPVALSCFFKTEFLTVPQEALITSMQTHQKCFPVVNAKQQLQPTFITISNIQSRDPNVVISGNERVINARLADAAFFYAQDSKQHLENLAPRLHHVVFQQQLGSLAAKTQRVVYLAENIAKSIGADVDITAKAAALAKCDLLTTMVGEFPNLQGTMGYYYALNDGIPKPCALAILQHYWPRFSGDKLPETLEGCALALADRLDTLVGIFGINQAPSGDKDPFALRRAALGICRLLIEKSLSVDLLTLLQCANDMYANTVKLINDNVIEDTQRFILQRLKSWYLEHGISVDVFAAVLACQSSQLLDFEHRVRAVEQFKQLPEAAALVAANKRVNNILKKQSAALPDDIDETLLSHPAEQQLVSLYRQYSAVIIELCQQSHYAQALTQLATLKPAIDEFFDHVMVMTDDNAVRLNRLALLSHVRQLFTQIADIALLQ